MAFNMFAKLSFNAPGVESKMKSIQKSWKGMKSSMSTIGAGVNQVGDGVKAAAMGLAPVSLLAFDAIKQSALFEQSLSAVQATMLATKEDMVGIRNESKRLGMTTKFTAQEAAEGAKVLAQGGFNVKQVMASMAGSLNLAASAEVSVADAANIMVSSLNAFAMDASESGKVADILAMATAATNTELIELGEGLKMVSAVSKQAGYDLGDTAFGMGVLANAGLKGTVAATAIRAALTQLSKPSKKAIALFGSADNFANAIQQANGKLRPFEDIMANVSQHIGTLRGADRLKAIGDISEILGIRGMVGQGAFEAQLQKQTLVTAANIDGLRQAFKNSGGDLAKFKLQVGDTVPELLALKWTIKAAKNTAQSMAEIRLDNLMGDVEKLSSAYNAVQIELGEIATVPLRPFVQETATLLQDLSMAFQYLNGYINVFNDNLGMINSSRPVDIDFGAAMKSTTAFANEFTTSIRLPQPVDMMGQFTGNMTPQQVQMIEFVKGLKEGFAEAAIVIKETGVSMLDFFKGLTGNENMSAKDLGKMIGKFGMLAVVAGPILIGLSAAFMILTPIISGVIGAIKMLFGSIRLVGQLVNFFLLSPFKWLFKNNAFGFIGKAMKSFGNVILRVGAFFKTGFLHVITKLPMIFSVVMTAIKAALAFLLTPFGLVVLAIAAIGIAAYILRDEIAAAFWYVVDWTKKTALAIGKWFGEAWDSISNGFSTAWTWIKDTANSVIGAIKTSIYSFVTSVIGNWFAIRNVAMMVWGTISDFAVRAFDNIKNEVKAFVFSLVARFTSFAMLVTKIWDGIKETATNVITGWKDKIVGFIDYVKELFTIFSQGNAEGGFFNGLLSAGSFVINTLVGKFDAFIDTIKNTFQTIFTYISDLSSNISNSIVSVFAGLIDAVNPFSSNTETPMTNQPGQAGMSDAYNNVKGALHSAYNANSAATNSQAVMNSASGTRTQNTQQNQPAVGNQPIVVHSTIKMDNKVIATGYGKSIIENSERRGKTLSPGEKRSLVQTGTRN